MTDASTRETVEALFDAFARRDIPAAAALVTEDFEFWPQGTSERAGRAEPYRGYAGLEEYNRDVLAVWDELSVEPGELRVAANGVVAFGTVRGIVGGVEHAIPVIWVFKLRDGRAATVRVVATSAEADAQLARQGSAE